MKRGKKPKKLFGRKKFNRKFILISSIIFLVLVVGIVVALNTLNEGYKVPTGDTEDKFITISTGYGAKITNNGALPIFVPTRTPEEFNYFVSNHPASVVVETSCANGRGSWFNCGGTVCCRIIGSSTSDLVCPNGWAQLQQWQANSPHYCSSCTSCTTPSFSFRDRSRESCGYRIPGISCAVGSTWKNCRAYKSEMGCIVSTGNTATIVTVDSTDGSVDEVTVTCPTCTDTIDFVCASGTTACDEDVAAIEETQGVTCTEENCYGTDESGNPVSYSCQQCG